MQFFIGLVIGLIFGGGCGLVIFALISASGDEEPSKPTTLIMPGQTVTYDAEVWEIKRLAITTDGQTVVALWNGSEELSVPVEEVTQ